ncbi:hypothetical protein ACJROX_28225 [Pseudalkalibacillus sp. A8]|uniref:hypothetical protein n=1 Tax=Pseudalkalibacillus sp. A8 TaxID=3382641 RepID=UPI0038B43BA9
MNIQVNLKDIIEEMKIQFEESRSLLNIKTGELVVVTSEDLISAEDDEPFDHLPDWQQVDRKIAINVIENFEDYKELPTKYEINDTILWKTFA